jgi:RNA polymerase II assessory factor
LVRPRVVAIFVTGFTHQFQGWPDGDRVPVLLSKSNNIITTTKDLERAFYMKYHDMPTHENIKKWNVKALEVTFKLKI